MDKSKNEELGINTFNEKSLHDELKKIYNADRYEAKFGRYIIDAIKGNTLIEVQTKNISSIKKKLENISKDNRVILVHPIIENKYLITEELSGNTTTRKSNKKQNFYSFFDELVSCYDILSFEKLEIHLYLIDVNEYRINDGKGSYSRRGISVINREIREVNNKIVIRNKNDLIEKIGGLPEKDFTVKDLSEFLGIDRKICQKICYTLKNSEIIYMTGKSGRSYLYSKIKK